MKLAIRILFTALVLLGIVGFIVSQTDNMPLVVKLIASDHYFAAQGLAKLESGKAVTSRDTGFNELSTIVDESIGIPDDSGIEKLILKSATTFLFGKATPKTENPVLVVLTTGQNLELDLFELRAGVEKLWKPKMLFWTSGLFALITVLEIIQFILSEKESNRPKRICEL